MTTDHIYEPITVQIPTLAELLDAGVNPGTCATRCSLTQRTTASTSAPPRRPWRAWRTMSAGALLRCWLAT